MRAAGFYLIERRACPATLPDATAPASSPSTPSSTPSLTPRCLLPRRATCKFDNLCLNASTLEFEYYVNTDLYPGKDDEEWRLCRGWLYRGPCPARAALRGTALTPARPPAPAPRHADMPVAYDQLAAQPQQQFSEHLVSAGVLRPGARPRRRAVQALANLCRGGLLAVVNGTPLAGARSHAP